MLSEDHVLGTSMECCSQNIMVANKTLNNSPILVIAVIALVSKGKVNFTRANDM